MVARSLRFFGVFMVVIFLSSCEYKLIEFDEPDPTVEISFDNDIIPILNNKCNVAGCHSAGHFVVDLTPAKAYIDLKAKNFIDTEYPAESQFYTILTKVGSTHAGRSTPSEQQLILQWIQQGAKDN
jgi:hypothetical protein